MLLKFEKKIGDNLFEVKLNVVSVYHYFKKVDFFLLMSEYVSIWDEWVLPSDF